MLSDGQTWYLRNDHSYLSTKKGYTNLFLTNVGLFSVLNLRCKVFAQGNFHVTDLEGEPIPDDPLVRWINNPNPEQARFEFLYNHLLYKGLGNNYINVKTMPTRSPNDINNVQALYNLNQDFIDFSNLERLNIPFIFAPSDVKRVGNTDIEYNFRSKNTKIPVKNLIIYNDLPNSIKDDNPIRGCSRVDALIPALSNIDEGQRSKNLNLHFGGTFVMSNEKKIDGNNTPLDPDQQKEIETKWRNKNIVATKTSLKGFRIANDLDKMIFDEQFAGDIQKLTQAYGMNRDVMNYFLQGSKFNDQENAAVSWIQNDIQFEGQIFSSGLEQYFNYPQQNKKVHMTFDHLPVMQVVEEKRAEKINLKADALNKLISAGIELEQALNLLNIELTENVRQ